MLVSELKEEHITQIEAIEHDCFADDAWSKNALLCELDAPHAVYFVCTEGEKVIAYAGMHNNLGEGYITNIAVDKSFRGKGAAKALINKLVDFAKTNTLDFLTLEVRESNEAAISLYSAFGFTKQGMRKNFYKNPTENANIMTLFIN